MIRNIERKDKENWIKLYCGYAKFYKVPMNQDILDILNSSIIPTDAISNSISRGTMSFEEKESRLTLFSKGYLGLFKRFTGKEIPLEEQNTEN